MFKVIYIYIYIYNLKLTVIICYYTQYNNKRINKNIKLKMLTEEIRSNLARLINQSQDGVACHPKLIIKCQQLFKQVKKFLFFNYLLIIFILSA